MNADQFLDVLANLRRWSSRGERAPHKPLLVLLALARRQRGDSGHVEFNDIEHQLRRLLEEFGPPRKSLHPEHPFWHLQSDGIWTLEDPESVAMRQGSSSPTLASLRSIRARGGFSPDVEQLLHQEPDLIVNGAQVILDAYFPPSIHEDLLNAVGLDVRVVSAGRSRDRDFRLEVLRAYEYRCAFCGYDGWLDTTSVGVDAAHIRWFAYGGADSLENALALCALHHRAFDRGVISVDVDRRIMVSRLFRGSATAQAMIIELVGKPAAEPQPGLPRPTEQNVRWHHREVFRGARRP